MCLCTARITLARHLIISSDPSQRYLLYITKIYRMWESDVRTVEDVLKVLIK